MRERVVYNIELLSSVAVRRLRVVANLRCVDQQVVGYAGKNSMGTDKVVTFIGEDAFG